MSESIKDGGPAFPGTWHPEMGWSPHHTPDGMSLRDWFAGMAMIGAVKYADAHYFENVAKQAYAMADAMLKAREAKS